MFDDALQQTLRSLNISLVAHDVNRNERATLLIGECLGSGHMVGSEILARITQIGLNSKHVGITLKRGPWRRSDDGNYHLNR